MVTEFFYFFVEPFTAFFFILFLKFLDLFIEFFWLLVFIVPSLSLTITRLVDYRKSKEVSSSALGKIVIGISYIAIIAIIIDFYKFEMLVFIAVLAYIYMVVDLYKIFRINKFKSRSF